MLSWKILQQFDTPHYKPGEWNTIKVRLTDKGIKGFVNGQLVMESPDTVRLGGGVGLAKFRDTEAGFKRFRVAKSIPSDEITAEVRDRLGKLIDGWEFDEPAPAKAVGSLAGEGSAGPRLLRDRAKELERRAEELRKLAVRVHASAVLKELEKEFAKPEAKVDLMRAALLVARLDNDELDVGEYLSEVDRMTRALKATLPEDADADAKRKALSKFLFEDRAFHGSRSEYYSRSNSYLNEVIDDREGLPLTLSMLYLGLAERIDLPAHGVGLSGHFVVRQADGPFIDVFERGEELSKAEAEQMARDRTGEEPVAADFAPATKRSMVLRMLRNLLGTSQEEQDIPAGMRYLDAIVLLEPTAARERFLRAGLLYFEKRYDEAAADAEWLEANPSPEVPGVRVRQLLEALSRVAEKP